MNPYLYWCRIVDTAEGGYFNGCVLVRALVRPMQSCTWAKIGRASSGSVTAQIFLQPDLDQRLVRDVARIRGALDGAQQVLGQSKRNRLGRGFQVRQSRLLGL